MKSDSLRIGSLKRLGAALGISPDVLEKRARRGGAFYRPFNQSKSRPKHARKPEPSKNRYIDNPVDPLKLIQHRIHKRLLADFPFPDYVMGGVKSRSLLKNVEPHVNARVVVTLDIHRFFPHVHFRYIYAVWADLLQCSPDVARVLTQLTTFRGYLPQGAPTSTSLANLVLLHADEMIQAKCADMGLSYTRWVDDLAFSGGDATAIIPAAISALKSSGFAVSRKKLRVMPASTRQIVTGVVVNDKASVSSNYIKNTRAGIYRMSMEPDASAINGILGRIAHIERFNPLQGEKLRSQIPHEFRV